MTFVACHGGVCSCQRERSVVVVERSPCPRCGCVARLASGREASCCMIRICRPIPVLLVASVTGGGKRRVVVIGVALRTLNRCVGSAQRERRVVAVERGRTPATRRMAYRAIGGES